MINEHRISIHRHYYRIAAKQCELYRALDVELRKLQEPAIAMDGTGEESNRNLAEHEAKYEQREMAAVISGLPENLRSNKLMITAAVSNE